MANNKVYEIITEQVLAEIEKGNVPWMKPWNMEWKTMMPTNVKSKKAYRGINVFLLAFSGYDSPYWLTFKQCQQLGGKVRKGEKSTIVCFWKMTDFTDSNDLDDDGNPTAKKIPLLRYYRVFNVDQCDIPEKKLAKFKNNFEELDFNPIEKAEKILSNMPNRPKISHRGSRAYYKPSTDEIVLPNRKTFKSEEQFYSTIFHELAHSTGHKSRLDRNTIGDGGFFGSENYSKEELIAEMAAAMLCGIAGIENKTLKNSSAYIKGWSKKLKEDSKVIVQAAQQAQKVCDFILNVTYEKKKEK